MVSPKQTRSAHPEEPCATAWQSNSSAAWTIPCSWARPKQWSKPCSALRRPSPPQRQVLRTSPGFAILLANEESLGTRRGRWSGWRRGVRLRRQRACPGSPGSPPGQAVGRRGWPWLCGMLHCRVIRIRSFQARLALHSTLTLLAVGVREVFEAFAPSLSRVELGPAVQTLEEPHAHLCTTWSLTSCSGPMGSARANSYNCVSEPAALWPAILFESPKTLAMSHHSLTFLRKLYLPARLVSLQEFTPTLYCRLYTAQAGTWKLWGPLNGSTLSRP